MTEVERLREALLPCPFCGETPVYDNRADRMVCGRCGAVGPAAMAYLSPKRRWNRRAALAATPPGAERWMPIETRSPHDEGACWVGHAPSQRIAIARPAKRLSGIWYTEGNNKMLPWLPTHYMPLPRPPAIPTGVMLAAAPPSPSAGEK